MVRASFSSSGISGCIYEASRTHWATTTIPQTLDAFEAQYGRLPDEQERRRLVEKLAWFDRHHQRVPTSQEMVQIVQLPIT